jgi:hypothetical protein
MRSVPRLYDKLPSAVIGTIKYGLESRGTQTRDGLRWRDPAAIVNYRPVLSLESILQNKKPATV